MGTAPSQVEREIIEVLRDLVSLDFGAIEAYDAAIDRLSDPVDRARLASFRADHVEHTRNVSEILRTLGETPPTGGDLKRFLTKGKVLLGGLVGDKQILVAMKSNEDETNGAYERAVGHTSMPMSAIEVLAKNLGDERRHRAWIEDRIAEMDHEQPSHGVSP